MGSTSSLPQPTLVDGGNREEEIKRNGDIHSDIGLWREKSLSKYAGAIDLEQRNAAR